jgi:hypothetical protein
MVMQAAVSSISANHFCSLLKTGIMAQTKIISTFNYCRDGELIKLTSRIVDGIKDNPHFPKPDPAAADVEKALSEYEVALTNAGGRDREMVSVKDDKRAILRQLLTDLAHYVTKTSKGDKTMLISSGFDVTPQRNKPKKLPPGLVVELGLPNQATTRVKRMARARVYQHQYTADPLMPDSEWKGETTVKHHHTFTGLPSGARTWFRVITINSKGEPIYWEPVLRIIQ